MITGARAVRGETFRLISASGGGYGDPNLRDREKLKADVRDGYVTHEQATRDYGLDLRGKAA
jgi:N-methylhydantoinase B